MYQHNSINNIVLAIWWGHGLIGWRSWVIDSIGWHPCDISKQGLVSEKWYDLRLLWKLACHYLYLLCNMTALARDSITIIMTEFRKPIQDLLHNSILVYLFICSFSIPENPKKLRYIRSAATQLKTYIGNVILSQRHMTDLEFTYVKDSGGDVRRTHSGEATGLRVGWWPFRVMWEVSEWRTQSRGRHCSLIPVTRWSGYVCQHVLFWWHTGGREQKHDG